MVNQTLGSESNQSVIFTNFGKRITNNKNYKKKHDFNNFLKNTLLIMSTFVIAPCRLFLTSRVFATSRIKVPSQHYCSKNDDSNDSDQNSKSKLEDILGGFRNQAMKKKSLKPVEMKAKPTKKNIQATSSSTSSSSSSDEEIDPKLVTSVKNVARHKAKHTSGNDDEKHQAKVNTGK